MGDILTKYEERLEEENLTKEQIKNSVKGIRFNKNKLRWSLVHYKSLEPMVRVLMFGAEKYEDDNWKKGLNKKQILESLQRHLAALMDGQTHDEESKLHHIGHIMCNAMFYSYFDLPENEHKCF
jgi:hypothetical protein